MKKRLISVFLVLVLVLMMSLPMAASAATKPTVETNEHHTWDRSVLMSTGMNYGNFHMRQDYVCYTCVVCQFQRFEWTDSYYEAHTLPCDICKGVTP